jgi:regulator of protease activity HflC (stomatin/prohibitin superfamily)
MRLALKGLLVQAVLCVALLFVYGWTMADSPYAALWFLLGGLPLWLMVMLLFYCRQLAAREALEIEEIAAHGGDQGVIFERAGALEQRPAARRVAWLEKWMAPLFTLLWAGVQVALIVLEEKHVCPIDIYNRGEGAVLLIVLAMFGFLFSYYCLGMAREEQWRFFRATGSYLLVGSILIGAAGVALLLAYWKGLDRVDDYVEYCVPFLQGLLAVELLLNFVLDLYRPRLPDQEHRFSFDSRLFNVLAEPGKVGHSIAETINYQFGFEVSKTWFYQLISRATVWLLLTSVAILLLLSCVLVVRDGETYLVRRMGRFLPGQTTVGPGLHFKLPWPLETAERFETGGVQQVLLGAGRERTEAEILSMDYVGRLEVLEWSKEHGEHEELDFLIAFPPRKTEDPPVHIIKLVVSVQYAIRDANRYGYQFVDPKGMLECLAYRELTQYFATATLDSPVAEGAKERPQAIMTFGRGAAAEELRKRVQAMADRFGMGVVLTNVAFVGVHPPPEAAKEFENVLKAQRAMEQRRFEAEGEAAQILTRQAGSPSAALQLALAIGRLDELKDLHSLRDDANGFRLQRQRYLRDANDRISALRAEVEQERLEGRLRGDAAQKDSPGERLWTDRQLLLQKYQEHRSALEALSSPADLSSQMADATATADRLFDQASGESAAVVSRAKGDRWSREMSGRGEWEGFQAALPAYLANPTMYQWDHWLAVWEDVLPGLYKYVLAVDRKNVEVRMDWTRPPSSLEEVNFQAKPAAEPKKP